MLLWIELLIAVLKFPGEVRAFVRLLQKAPEEKRQEIMQKIAKEQAAFEQGDRPKWD